ncbi:MAG: DUF4392 domain-containing protein [Candidatus Lambdaproteobacteria bacterium]|nr:DUF4392 domain-containing protein [Candidatus Lambdaproteobacteria bacterium]
MHRASEKPAIQDIERLIAQDPGRRGIGALVQPGHLEGAARALLAVGRVLIAGGFYVLEAGAGETDGPPGVKALGQALTKLGANPLYVTDALNRPLFERLGLAPLHEHGPGLLARLAPDALVAIERVGRAADGRYYNMRGRDISAVTAPLDEMFLAAAAAGLPTVGIGDGGNEIGMGRVAELVRQTVAEGARIACVVPTEHLIVAGVSNWGAWGLVGALGVLAGRDLLPSVVEVRADVAALLAAGAVDGVTRRPEPTVDGLPLEASLAVLEAIRAVVTGSLGAREAQPSAAGDAAC